MSCEAFAFNFASNATDETYDVGHVVEEHSSWAFSTVSPPHTASPAVDTLSSGSRTPASRCSPSPPNSPELGPANVWRRSYVERATQASRKVEFLPGTLCRETRCVHDTMMEAARALDCGIKPDLVEDGFGGTYFIKNCMGVAVAVFKPRDEEPMAPNNPKRHPGRGGAGLKEGVLVGEVAINEYAAFLLDRSVTPVLRAGVQPTALVRIENSVFHDTSEDRNAIFRSIKDKTGSFQLFAQHDCTAEDMGPSLFPVDQVHRIAVLDIRLCNTDRHVGNILLRKCGGELSLIPIDHGYALPGEVGEAMFDWLSWPAAKKPFSDEMRREILAVDPDRVERLLTARIPLRTECLTTLRICTVLLQTGAEAGLTAFDIGMLMTREDLIDGQSTSVLEDLVAEAKLKAAESGLPWMWILRTLIHAKCHSLAGSTLKPRTEPRTPETSLPNSPLSCSLVSCDQVSDPSLLDSPLLSVQGLTRMCILQNENLCFAYLDDTAPLTPVLPRLEAAASEAERALKDGSFDFIEDGLGGTYFLKNARCARVAVFKPRATDFAGEALTPCLNEVAAFLLDRTSGKSLSAGVSPAVLVRASGFSADHRRPHFEAEDVCFSLVEHNEPPGASEDRIGSFQLLAPSDCTAEDISPDRFPVDQVHRIAALDIRLCNANRHMGSVLVRTSGGVTLLPVDHGDSLGALAEFTLDWLSWPAAMEPFSEAMRREILAIDPERSELLLRKTLPLSSASLATLRLGTALLQRGVEAGLSPFDIGSLMVRPDPTTASSLEVWSGGDVAWADVDQSIRVRCLEVARGHLKGSGAFVALMPRAPLAPDFDEPPELSLPCLADEAQLVVDSCDLLAARDPGLSLSRLSA